MGGVELLKGADFSEERYFKIPFNIYKPGDLIEEDLYFRYDGKYLLYRLKNLSWKKSDQQQLAEFGIRDLYIQCPSERTHQRFLENNLHRILDEPHIPAREKAEALYSTSISIVEEIFERPQSPETVKRSIGSVKHSIDYLNKDKSHFFELMNLAKKDFSEYTHALHTAAYAITLAKQLGIKAFNQISSLGIGSILHDIGKVKINSALLDKQEALTPEELKEVEKHSQYGYEMIHRLGMVPELSEVIILQHHERPTGRGYPHGISDEIHLLSKIVSLCDCFDLLTSERSYRKALKPIDAIDYLRTEVRDEYDQNLLTSFIAMLKK